MLNAVTRSSTRGETVALVASSDEARVPSKRKEEVSISPMKTESERDHQSEVGSRLQSSATW